MDFSDVHNQEAYHLPLQFGAESGFTSHPLTIQEGHLGYADLQAIGQPYMYADGVALGETNDFANPPHLAVGKSNTVARPPAATRSRRQMYTNAKWSEMRPIMCHLYIDREMTLHEMMRELNQTHQFYPTEQMCKKRIRAWADFKKNMKTNEKDEAIAGVLGDDASASIDQCVLHADARPAKLLRHAQARLKVGKVDSNVVERLQQLYRTKPHIVGDNCSAPNFQMNTRYKLSRCPRITRSLEGSDGCGNNLLMFKALGATVSMLGQYRAVESFNDVYADLYQGITWYTINAFAKARFHLDRAGSLFAESLRHQDMISLRAIFFLLGFYRGGDLAERVGEMFARYAESITKELLGASHPLMIATKLNAQTKSSGHQKLALLDCMQDALEDGRFSLPARRFFAEKRLQIYGDFKLGNRGLECFKELYEPEPERLKQWTKGCFELRFQLAELHYAEGNFNEALSLLEELTAATAALPYQKLVSLLRSGVLYERKGKPILVYDCLFRGLEIAQEAWGPTSPSTILALERLLDFTRHMNWKKEARSCIERFDELYQHLLAISEGLWNLDFQRWISAGAEEQR